jgi:hypothetical protein
MNILISPYLQGTTNPDPLEMENWLWNISGSRCVSVILVGNKPGIFWPQK